MNSIIRSEIPNYLHSSLFYRALNEDDELFLLPSKYYKTDELIGNIEDLQHYLETCRFWGLQHISVHLLEFLLTSKVDKIETVLTHFRKEFSYIPSIILVMAAEPNLRMIVAIQTKNTEVIDSLYKYGYHWNTRLTSLAAGFGSLSLLQWLLEHGCLWDQTTCSNAAAFGHLECLKYAHEHGCPWDETTCSNSSYRGHLNCLQYAHIHGCPWDAYTTLSGYLPNRECISYAISQGCPILSTPEPKPLLSTRSVFSNM